MTGIGSAYVGGRRPVDSALLSHLIFHLRRAPTPTQPTVTTEKRGLWQRRQGSIETLNRRMVMRVTEDLMTPEHPRWDEFCNLLEGPEGCDFKDDGLCESDSNLPMA